MSKKRKGLWLLKNSSQEIRENKIASGCSINDFFGSPRHFPSPNFRCFEAKASFSTPTPDYNNYFLFAHGAIDCGPHPYSPLNELNSVAVLVLIRGADSLSMLEKPQREALAMLFLLFGGIGLLVSLAIAGLASVAPSVFGWLTLPFWFLPRAERVPCLVPGCERTYDMYGCSPANLADYVETLQDRVKQEHPDHTSEVLAVNEFRKVPM